MFAAFTCNGVPLRVVAASSVERLLFLFAAVTACGVGGWQAVQRDVQALIPGLWLVCRREFMCNEKKKLIGITQECTTST